jgi:hypothetical protein
MPSLADVSKYGISFLLWHHCCARFVDTLKCQIYVEFQSNVKFHQTTFKTYSSILQIDFIAQNYERKMLWISGTCLNEELITPQIEIFKCVWCCCVKDENTTISSTIECDTKWLKTFLTSCVPNLSRTNICYSADCARNLMSHSPASSQRDHQQRLPLSRNQRQLSLYIDLRIFCSHTDSWAMSFPPTSHPKWWLSAKPSFLWTFFNLENDEKWWWVVRLHKQITASIIIVN